MLEEASAVRALRGSGWRRGGRACQASTTSSGGPRATDTQCPLPSSCSTKRHLRPRTMSRSKAGTGPHPRAPHARNGGRCRRAAAQPLSW